MTEFYWIWIYTFSRNMRIFKASVTTCFFNVFFRSNKLYFLAWTQSSLKWFPEQKWHFFSNLLSIKPEAVSKMCFRASIFCNRRKALQIWRALEFGLVAWIKYWNLPSGAISPSLSIRWNWLQKGNQSFISPSNFLSQLETIWIFLWSY